MDILELDHRLTAILAEAQLVLEQNQHQVERLDRIVSRLKKMKGVIDKEKTLKDER